MTMYLMTYENWIEATTEDEARELFKEQMLEPHGEIDCIEELEVLE